MTIKVELERTDFLSIINACYVQIFKFWDDDQPQNAEDMGRIIEILNKRFDESIN